MVWEAGDDISLYHPDDSREEMEAHAASHSVHLRSFKCPRARFPVGLLAFQVVCCFRHKTPLKAG